jgi:hypothetical protein
MDSHAPCPAPGLVPHAAKSLQGEHWVTFSTPGNAAEKTICGLRRTTFGLVAVIAVLIIAGAVGGGFGGSMAAKQSCKSGVDVPQRRA